VGPPTTGLSKISYYIDRHDSNCSTECRAAADASGLHRLTSTIVMKRIVENRPLPLTSRND
jgi:hypothetical protein